MANKHLGTIEAPSEAREACSAGVPTGMGFGEGTVGNHRFYSIRFTEALLICCVIYRPLIMVACSSVLQL